uniref:Uncharacterized protein n=1 Tax=Arundo donax TaxID=35708 RepID=A0A0A8ZM36_ARUDO
MNNPPRNLELPCPSLKEKDETNPSPDVSPMHSSARLPVRRYL